MPAYADPTRVAIDVDALEVLESTQTLGEDKPGGDTVDRERGTILTGGDVDAAWYSDTEPLRPEEKEKERDEKRWEMDPAEPTRAATRQMRKPRFGSGRARSTSVTVFRTMRRSPACRRRRYS